MNQTQTYARLLSIIEDRRLSPATRSKNQRAVFEHVLRNSARLQRANFSSIAAEDLGTLFHSIDEYFFDGSVSSLCEQVSCKPLSFRLSTRMTSSGGMTTMQTNRGRKRAVEFEIAIATTPLFDTFKLDASSVVGGLTCENRMEALQRIMEHEMIHLIEMLLWKDSNCSADPFRKVVRRFFGHLESNHQLLTPRDVARKHLGISIGDQVSFVHQKRMLVGFVNRISKRATVLVASPEGNRYTDGHRYEKYYVPLKRLRRVESKSA